MHVRTKSVIASVGLPKFVKRAIVHDGYASPLVLSIGRVERIHLSFGPTAKQRLRSACHAYAFHVTSAHAHTCTCICMVCTRPMRHVIIQTNTHTKIIRLRLACSRSPIILMFCIYFLATTGPPSPNQLPSVTRGLRRSLTRLWSPAV